MQWVAIYADNTELPQYNGDGSENRYADIDRTRLKQFVIKTEEDPVHPVLVMNFAAGQRLIYRRRVELTPNGEPYVVTMVGWQKTVNGENLQSIAFLFPDKHIEWSGRWEDGHRWYYAPELLPFEAA